MKGRIDLKVLIIELRDKIKEFYPYFFSFYLLSLVVSIFSKTWRSFFYWPAFHGSIIFFTLFFVLSFKFDFRLNRGFRIVGFTKNSIQQTRLQLKQYFIFINSQLARLSRHDWLKTFIIIAILIFALSKEINVLNFLVLFYALTSFLFILNSRLSGVMALLCLSSCPILLIFKKDALAEIIAIYAYYFLVITVLTQIRELKQEKNLTVDNS